MVEFNEPLTRYSSELKSPESIPGRISWNYPRVSHSRISHSILLWRRLWRVLTSTLAFISTQRWAKFLEWPYSRIEQFESQFYLIPFTRTLFINLIILMHIAGYFPSSSQSTSNDGQQNCKVTGKTPSSKWKCKRRWHKGRIESEMTFSWAIPTSRMSSRSATLKLQWNGH